MKSLNAKRIAAVAASLLMGMAVAGQGVTFGNIPIINSAGQPVVQIVVGSTAQPSDGVVAANIAATIGSLAHTSQNITATVNGRSGVSCVVTTPTCTLSNQQVWLGEKGLTVAAGSYTFTALIGSVLNGAVLNSGNLQNSKFIFGSSSNAYVYPDGTTAPYSITTSPTAPSVYTGIGLSPASSVISNTNGGGMQFTRFTNNSVDNILRLSNSQVPGLLSSAGAYQESEYIWLGGFPVYNQASNVSSFGVMDTQAAYQIAFGKPIQNRTNGASTNAQFTLLGQNWTVYNLLPPSIGTTGVSSNSFVVGGNVTLAQASTPVTTVYVGHNITSGPFTVVLNDLSYPNANGLSNAALAIYKNGVLTNVTSVGPASSSTQVTINSSGTKLFISVPQTFPGLYAYQKWAKIQLFSNTFNVSSGKDFNEVTNGHKWLALIRWTTNYSTASTSQRMFAVNAALQGIIVYTNQTQANLLTPGQSLNIMTNPAVWKLNFVGDSLGTPGSGNTNYDQLSITTGSSPSVTYQNANGGVATLASTNYNSINSAGLVTGGSGATSNTINSTVVTEAANLFTVSSTLPNAFLINPTSSYSAPTSNLQSVQYDLDSYKLLELGGVDSAGTANVQTATNGGLVIRLTNLGLSGNYVTSTNPLNVQIQGYRSGAGTVTTQSVTFNGFNQLQTLPGTALGNVTGISLSTALPAPGVNASVWETSNILAGNYLSYPTNPIYTYLAGNTAVSNTISTTASNSVTISLGANVIQYQQPVTISAFATNTAGNANIASNALAIYINGALVANNIAATNTVTYTLFVGSNTLGASTNSYVVNAIDTNSGNTIQESLLIVPSAVLLGRITWEGPVLFYKVPSHTYSIAPLAGGASTNSTVTYTGESTNVNFVLGQVSSGTGSRNQYFTYSIPELTASTTTTPNANTIIGITNSSQIGSTPLYWLNVSSGNNNAVTYSSSQGNNVKAVQGFRTERGSQLASVGTTSLTYNLAKSVDGLQFVVGPSAGNSTSSTKSFGPYGVGQATNIANVTIAKVNATCAFSTTSCSVSGLSNLTGVPSARQAVVATSVNTATTPLAVLDSQANNASTLIVVGSKYVNSVAAQIFAQNPSFASSFGPTGPNSVAVQAFGTNRILVAGYSASQTVQAGNEFIQALLASAST